MSKRQLRREHGSILTGMGVEEAEDMEEPTSISLQEANAVMYNFADERDKRIVVQHDLGTMKYEGIELSKRGIDFKRELSEEDWIELGRVLRTYDTAIQWMLGDWLNHGIKNAEKWGKVDEQAESEESRYTPLLAQTDYQYGTLANFASVARAVTHSRRREAMSFSHHVEVAKLAGDEQEKFLELAEEQNLSVRELRKLIKGNNGKAPRVVSYVSKAKQRLAAIREKAPSLNKDERKDLIRLFSEMLKELQELDKKAKAEASQANVE
jgi:hypothetical protein